MTRTDLKAITRKKLATIARENQIPGWHAMRKSDLVDILAAMFRSRQRASTPAKHGHTNGKPTNGKTVKANQPNGESAAMHRPSNVYTSQNGRYCRLPSINSSGNNSQATRKDQLVVEVRDSSWLYVQWELSAAIIDRAEAAMGVEWRQAEPVLRVFDVTEDQETTGTKTFVRDIEIHQPLDNWYVPVDQPGQTYRLQLGYRAPSGNFFVVARSAKVKTPRSGSLPTSSRHSSFESNSGNRQSLPRPNADGRSDAHAAGSTTGNAGHHHPREVTKELFEVDAEIVVFGQTHPLAQLTVLGKPVQQQQDGRFSIRMSLEDGRQVIPAVCITPNGCEQRTTVLAIERNTKHLEILSLDEME